jgi:hypothetical protein
VWKIRQTLDRLAVIVESTGEKAWRRAIDMTARLVLGIAVLASVAGAARAADAGPARPVAIVTEVAGPARIVVRGRTVSPDVADSVEEGAIVVLERDARIALTYPAAGSIYELHGPGRFIVHRDAIESRTASGQLARRDLIPELRALRIHAEGSALRGSAAMRGASAVRLQAYGPSGSQLSRDPLRLCWRSLGPQWIYRVRLIDDDGIVQFEAQTIDSEFELPATVPLEPNAPILWHVLATGPNGQSAEAAGQFRRLDPASEHALLQAESAVSESDASERMLLRIARYQLGIAPDGASGCDRDRPGSALNASNSAGPE